MAVHPHPLQRSIVSHFLKLVLCLIIAISNIRCRQSNYNSIKIYSVLDPHVATYPTNNNLNLIWKFVNIQRENVAVWWVISCNFSASVALQLGGRWFFFGFRFGSHQSPGVRFWRLTTALTCCSLSLRFYWPLKWPLSHFHWINTNYFSVNLFQLQHFISNELNFPKLDLSWLKGAFARTWHFSHSAR